MRGLIAQGSWHLLADSIRKDGRTSHNVLEIRRLLAFDLGVAKWHMASVAGTLARTHYFGRVCGIQI